MWLCTSLSICIYKKLKIFPKFLEFYFRVVFWVFLFLFYSVHNFPVSFCHWLNECDPKKIVWHKVIVCVSTRGSHVGSVGTPPYYNRRLAPWEERPLETQVWSVFTVGKRHESLSRTPGVGRDRCVISEGRRQGL